MNLEQKTEYRIKARRILEGTTAESRDKASQAIADAVLGMPEIVNSHTIFIYISFDYEVATEKIIEGLLEMGKTVCVPKLRGGEMHPVPYTRNLVPNEFGIMEPAETNYIVNNVCLAIVPALLFDYNRNRLGRGKGYYDRYFLCKEVYKIGLGFDVQIVDNLPANAFDMKMDKIVTESRIL